MRKVPLSGAASASQLEDSTRVSKTSNTTTCQPAPPAQQTSSMQNLERNARRARMRFMHDAHLLDVEPTAIAFLAPAMAATELGPAPSSSLPTGMTITGSGWLATNESTWLRYICICMHVSRSHGLQVWNASHMPSRHGMPA